MDLHDDDDTNDLNEELEVNDGGAAKFAPIEVKSGEEQFNVLYQVKSKLLRFDEGENVWKERGQGDAKILQFKAEPHRHMFILRRDGVGKLAASHELKKGIELKQHPSSEKAFIWTCIADWSDEDDEGYPDTFCIKLGTKELADEFRAHFDAVTKGKK
jgi:hypothetical protein